MQEIDQTSQWILIDFQTTTMFLEVGMRLVLSEKPNPGLVTWGKSGWGATWPSGEAGLTLEPGSGYTFLSQ